jgi:Skp family chaperone for outer membrane proteins
MGAFIGDLLRQQRLAQQLGLTNGQSQIPPYLAANSPQDQNQSTQGQVQPPLPQQQQTSEQPSPRDQALSDYRQALQSSAPTYNPSVPRRIIGGVLGAGVGMTNPQGGKGVAQEITHGPYNQALTKYQENLARKKQAFETESSSELESAKTEEQREQKKAEVERAGAESSRRAGEQFKISPEGQSFELKKLMIEHPNTPKISDYYKLELKNGETAYAIKDKTGQFVDDKGTIYSGSEDGPIKNAYKIGTEPRATTAKPEREGEAGAIDAWTSEHGRAPNYTERLAIHRSYADKPQDSGVAGVTKEFKLQSAKDSAARPYQRSLDQSTQQLDRINRAIEEVDSSKPEYLATAIPTVLTALVSGQGTGVRITQAEMNSLIKARGLGDSVEAFTNKISGQGNLSTQQKKDLKGLLSDVQKKVSDRQKDYSNTMDEIYDSDGVEGINKARTKFNKKLTGQDQNQNQKQLTPEELRKKYGY